MPVAELGIAIDGRAPLDTVAAQAQAAEEGGASTLWLACHLYLRDPVTTAALAFESRWTMLALRRVNADLEFRLRTGSQAPRCSRPRSAPPSADW